MQTEPISAQGQDQSLNNNEPETVTDSKGRVYTVLRNNTLGKGGQGQVLRVAEDRYLAIKESFVEGKEHIKAYQDNIRRLRYLPIPHTARISMPIAVLQDKAGFVMRLLNQMQPLMQLMITSVSKSVLQQENIPDWIQLEDESENAPNKKQAQEYNNQVRRLVFFANTGGLRARLSWLMQLAELLELLHNNGLIFADISPNNVYISSGINQQVWLIDVDNIAYESEFKSIVATPDYGAHEIVTRQLHNTMASDVFSFALLAFECLSGRKPFDGSRHPNSDINNDVTLPWLFDSQDYSNHLNQDIFLLQYNMSLPLFQLFKQTFEEGRLTLAQRPPIWMWREVLSRTLDVTIKCPDCGMGYIFSESPKLTCPFCDTSLQVLTAHDSEQQLLWSHELTSEQCDLMRHVLTPCSHKEDQSLLRLKAKNGQLYFEFMETNTQEMLNVYLIPQGTNLSTLMIPGSTFIATTPIFCLNKSTPVGSVDLAKLVNHELVIALDVPISWPIKLALRSNR